MVRGGIERGVCVVISSPSQYSPFSHWTGVKKVGAAVVARTAGIKEGGEAEGGRVEMGWKKREGKGC